MPADLREPAPEPGPVPGVGVLACGCGCTCGGGGSASRGDLAAGVPDPAAGASGVEAGAADRAVVAEFLDPGLPRSERLTEALDGTPTGVPLARLLEALDPRSLDDFDLAEVAAGFTRMSGWAHAGLAGVAVELARRQGMGPRLDPRAPRGRGVGLTSQRVAAMTLSARLKRSPQDTAALIREGADFAGALAETGAALRQGRISVPAARVIAARLGDQVAWVSGPVQDYVLPRAPHSTVAQVRVDLERALLRVDPEHAQDRRDTARAARRVTHPRALPDQMAEMHLVLPAEHAIGIDTALQAAAGASPAATPGYLPSPRDTEAPPSEAASGADAPTSTSTSPGAGRAATRDPRTHVLVTVALSTLIGQDDTPADLAGHGPIDATTARALAQGGVWRRLVTDDLSGTVLDVGRTTYRPPAALADHVRHRDRTCTFPGCPVPAHHCDLDHTQDWAPAPEDPHPPGRTSHTNLGPTCPRHHRAKHHARFTLQQPEPGTHDWTDPTGHTYRTRPGTDHPTQHLTGPRSLRAPAPDTPPDPPAPAISPDTPPSGVPSDSSTSGAPRGAAAPYTPAPRPPAPRPPAPRPPAPRPPAPHASDDDPPPY